MLANAGSIKNTFEYVWFPPASLSASNEGYLPTQLNNLNSNYGSETQLKNAINSIKPAKAIADIVINHRCGTSDWGDFTNPSWNEDYYSICSDDEGFTGSSKMRASSKRGSRDTGEGYSAGRDLDHTNLEVQNGIVYWMNNVLKNAGFVGWRYDFVKGYSGYYVGKYNYNTNAEFSVGEYWPTNGFSPSNSSNWSNEIVNWINSTANGGYKTRAFDFVLKGNLNYAFGYKGEESRWDMTRLADSNNLFRRMPQYAVTFVDNHDTGSTQGHWPIDEGDIGPAYAFILTHPGYPCVAWQHYFTGSGSQYIGGKTVSGTSNTMKNHIDQLISIRKSNGICYDSAIQVLQSNTYLYAAKITGTKGSIIVKIGGNSYTPSDSSYKVVYSGTNFCVWSNMSSGSGSSTGSGSSNGTGSSTTTGKYRLVASVNPGYNYAVYFTGSFNEGSNWTKAVRGTYSSSLGGWYVEVNGSNFEWKYMVGPYNLGSTISTSTSGLQWQSGSNYTVANATLISSGSSSGSTSSGSSSSTGSSSSGSSSSSSGSGTSTTNSKVTLSATYNVGSNNAIYFTGTFDEGKTWTTAVRGTWTTGNVWKVNVTVPSSKSFQWKVLKGPYNYGTTVSTSYLTWESGSNHTQSTTSITPRF